MDEHKDTDQPEKQSTPKEPPAFPPPIDPPPPPPEAHPENGDASEKIGKSDKILLSATVVIAIGTLVSAGAIWLQYRVMVNGGADTTAIKVAAQQQATAAQQFADTAKLINGGIQGAVDKLNLQAGALNDSVKQASRLAEATEKANANVLESDRPWIGIAVRADDLILGGIPTYTLSFINTGKRPAIVTNMQIEGRYFTKFPKDPPSHNWGHLV